MRDQMAADPGRRAVYEAVLAEAEALWRVWDACRDAQCEYMDESVRRDALRRLAGYVGRDAYWRGELPPPVPYWRFREMR